MPGRKSNIASYFWRFQLSKSSCVESWIRLIIGFLNHVSSGKKKDRLLKSCFMKNHLLANGIGDFCYGLSTKKTNLVSGGLPTKTASSFLQSPEMKKKWKSGNASNATKVSSLGSFVAPTSLYYSIPKKCCLTFLSIISVLQTTWDLNYSTTKKKNTSTKKLSPSQLPKKINQPNQPNHFPRRKFPAP